MLKLTIKTSTKKQIIDLTGKIAKLVNQHQGKDGVCVVFVTHTTCALTCADLDPGTDLDMLEAFEKIIPQLKYRHPHDPKHVGDHIMSAIIGPSVALPFINGKLVLGTWQRVVLLEFSGPRDRELIVNLIYSE